MCPAQKMLSRNFINFRHWGWPLSTAVTQSDGISDRRQIIGSIRRRLAQVRNSGYVIGNWKVLPLKNSIFPMAKITAPTFLAQLRCMGGGRGVEVGLMMHLCVLVSVSVCLLTKCIKSTSITGIKFSFCGRSESVIPCWDNSLRRKGESGRSHVSIVWQLSTEWTCG